MASAVATQVRVSILKHRQNWRLYLNNGHTELMFRPLPSFFQQFDKWFIYFYYAVSNGLVLLLQWLVTERSHKEDLADSSATNIYHRYMTLQWSVAILKCLHWTNVCSKRPKWFERTYDAGGERTAWRIHCIYRNRTATFNHVAPPQLCEEFGVNVSWTQWGVAGLRITSVIQAGCGAKNMLLAEGQSTAADDSCHAVSDAL